MWVGSYIDWNSSKFIQSNFANVYINNSERFINKLLEAEVRMPAILRIDVDTAYQNRILNYARVNKELFLGIDSLGYLKSCKLIADDLFERGITASFFFLPFTLPSRTFVQELMKEGHNVGLHAVHTKEYTDFSADIHRASKSLGKILGFTKHGSGRFKLSRSHDPNYNSDKFIDFARMSNLKFFLGNGENPDEGWQYKDGVLYFPSAFWLNRNYREDNFTVDWLVKASRDRDVVVLMHPEDVMEGTNLMTREYERIMGKVEFMPVLQKIEQPV